MADPVAACRKRPTRRKRKRAEGIDAVRERTAARAFDAILERLDPAKHAEARALVLARVRSPEDAFDTLSFLFWGGAAVQAAVAATGQPKVVTPEEVYECADYACPSCGRRQSRTWEKQTRALDEGVTTFCQCVCGRTWRL
jgi:DNA-directed RNA polymerase subunit M/transcription elongation factor TFIIS